MSARERWSGILDIQKSEAERGDEYMRGLYNGMLMMVCNFDGHEVEYHPMPKRAQPAPDDAGVGEGVGGGMPYEDAHGIMSAIARSTWTQDQTQDHALQALIDYAEHFRKAAALRATGA